MYSLANARVCVCVCVQEQEAREQAGGAHGGFPGTHVLWNIFFVWEWDFQLDTKWWQTNIKFMAHHHSVGGAGFPGGAPFGMPGLQELFNDPEVLMAMKVRSLFLETFISSDCFFK